MSKRFTLNRADWVAFGKNALEFSAPVLIVAIPAIIAQIPVDWKYALLAVYLLNRLLDLLKRFVAGK